MATIDFSTIAKGLDNIQAVKDTLTTVGRFEQIAPDLIHKAKNNPYSLNDTPETIKELATSIEAHGLMHPLVVRKTDDYYELISGERRYTAITTHLKWRSIPCMVYDGISDTQAQIMLHDANLSTREYTPAEKLRFYPQICECIQELIDKGEYKGGKQQAVAEMLNISTRQVRKYKALVENLTEKEIEQVADGDISLNSAYKKATAQKSGTGSAENDELSEEFWYSELRRFCKYYWGKKEIYLYYVFNVPTTAEAIKQKLSPTYGYSGGANGEYDYTLRNTKIEIKLYGSCLKRKPNGVPDTKEFTYSVVDSIIRELIRENELISIEDVRLLLKAKNNNLGGGK